MDRTFPSGGRDAGSTPAGSADICSFIGKKLKRYRR